MLCPLFPANAEASSRCRPSLFLLPARYPVVLAEKIAESRCETGGVSASSVLAAEAAGRRMVCFLCFTSRTRHRQRWQRTKRPAKLSSAAGDSRQAGAGISPQPERPMPRKSAVSEAGQEPALSAAEEQETRIPEAAPAKSVLPDGRLPPQTSVQTSARVEEGESEGTSLSSEAPGVRWVQTRGGGPLRWYSRTPCRTSTPASRPSLARTRRTRSRRSPCALSSDRSVASAQRPCAALQCASATSGDEASADACPARDTPHCQPPSSRRARRRQKQLARRLAEREAQAQSCAASPNQLAAEGVSCPCAAAHLQVASRTLRSWRQDFRQPWDEPDSRGRPCLEVDLLMRNEVFHFLQHVTGPAVGLPALQDLFPTVPRCVLQDLLVRYRCVWRWRYAQGRLPAHLASRGPSLGDGLHETAPADRWRVPLPAEHSRSPRRCKTWDT